MKDVENLHLIRTKRITKKRQKKIKRKMNIAFLIGFLIPTINAIYQQVNVNSENQKYLIAMLVFIIIDVLLYIPIFIINRNPLLKGNNKMKLLILLQLRNLEKVMLALYSLIYFIISSNINFTSIFTNFGPTLQKMLENGMSLTMSLLSAIFTLLVGNDNRKFKKELFDSNFTVSTYELEKETGDVIMKTYINKLNPVKIKLKKIAFNLVSLCLVVLFSLFMYNWF